MTVNKSFTGALRKGDQPGQVRGRYALVVPTGLSKKNGARLKTELAEQGGTVLGVDDCGLLLVRWDADTRVALFGLKDVTAAYPDRIRSSVLRKMPKKAARLGRLWNWSHRDRGIGR